MAQAAPLYDLTLLLSTSAEDDVRAKIVTDVETAISDAGGSIERRDDWGRRPMAFRINHQAEAEYHLLQFTGPTALLDSLSHSLRISDQVLRFRIIKNIPGTPAAPSSAPPVIATAPAGSGASTSPGAGGAPAAGAGVGAGAGAEASAGAGRDSQPEASEG